MKSVYRSGGVKITVKTDKDTAKEVVLDLLAGVIRDEGIDFFYQRDLNMAAETIEEAADKERERLSFDRSATPMTHAPKKVVSI